MSKPAGTVASRPIPKLKKRKAEGGEAGGTALKKKRAKKANFEEEDSLMDVDKGINTAFQFMDSSLTADYLAQQTSRFGKELSTIELADLSISGNVIHDTTSWDKPRTLDNMTEFLEKFANDPRDLTVKPKENGTPHTIIVAGAGIRAADVVRSMRKYQTKDVKVAKCFAKHIKMKEAVEFLNTHKTGVAVGTPQRLIDLVENGALKVDKLDRLVVDASHIDQKKRGVLDMGETVLPLCRWLTMSQLKERYVDEKKPLKLMFY